MGKHLDYLLSHLAVMRLSTGRGPSHGIQREGLLLSPPVPKSVGVPVVAVLWPVAGDHAPTEDCGGRCDPMNFIGPKVKASDNRSLSVTLPP